MWSYERAIGSWRWGGIPPKIWESEEEGGEALLYQYCWAQRSNLSLLGWRGGQTRGVTEGTRGRGRGCRASVERQCLVLACGPGLHTHSGASFVSSLQHRFPRRATGMSIVVAGYSLRQFVLHHANTPFEIFRFLELFYDIYLIRKIKNAWDQQGYQTWWTSKPQKSKNMNVSLNVSNISYEHLMFPHMRIQNQVYSNTCKNL